MAMHDSQHWRREVYNGIGREVNRRRMAAKLTLREVAFKLGTTFQAVQRVEEGEGVPTHFLVAFAQLVQCSINDLVPHVPAIFPRVIQPSDG